MQVSTRRFFPSWRPPPSARMPAQQRRKQRTREPPKSRRQQEKNAHDSEGGQTVRLRRRIWRNAQA